MRDWLRRTIDDDDVYERLIELVILTLLFMGFFMTKCT